MNRSPRDLLRRLEIDRPVFFGLLAKGWGLCAGPVTALLIATRFSPELQGYYFTFATILALKTFVELGLGTVVIQFASHEWAKLSLAETGAIAGDERALQRLRGIARFALRWYLAAAAISVVGLGVAGFVFFSSSASAGVDWVAPWWALCAVTGATLAFVPLWSVLEGCNQVSALYTFRFVQGVVGSVCVWLAIAAGAGLWSAAISGLATLGCGVIFLRRRYGSFFRSLAPARSGGEALHWRSEMWPMQWRIAISWIGGYFVFSFFVPVVFHFHGPVLAGQMGMTWGIVSIVGSLADAWLSPRVPGLGVLIARRDYRELDRQFWRVTRITITVAVVVAVAIGLAVVALHAAPFAIAQRLAGRLLTPGTTAVLLAAYVVYMAASPFSVYLRAHKQEPLMVFSVVYTALVGCSTLVLGRIYSVTGIAVGFLTLNLLMVPAVVWIWARCRAAWHT